MRGRNHWWILWLAAALLIVPACTDNNLDESDADVVLQVLTLTNPPVTGDVELGTCSVSLTPCLTNDNCPDTEVCNPPVLSGECTITEWSVTFVNSPLNEGGVESPFNDVTMEQVIIVFEGTGPPEAEITVGLSDIVIPANGSGIVTFLPITQAVLATVGDNQTLDLSLTFTGVTEAGHTVVKQAGAQLFIENCFS